MPKYTPGPWKRSERADGNWWHIGARNQAIAAVHAASPKRNEPYAGMFEANANLIAAAPELLEMLEAIYEMDTGYGLGPTTTEIEALIAKAKGGIK